MLVKFPSRANKLIYRGTRDLKVHCRFPRTQSIPWFNNLLTTWRRVIEAIDHWAANGNAWKHSSKRCCTFLRPAMTFENPCVGTGNSLVSAVSATYFGGVFEGLISICPDSVSSTAATRGLQDRSQHDKTREVYKKLCSIGLPRHRSTWLPDT